jgi:para-nitrobenzyl esterase
LHTRFLTDLMFRIPGIRLAEAAHRHSPNTHCYLLAWNSPPQGDRLGAFHGVDVPLMWKTRGAAAALTELAGQPLPVELSEAMHGAWVEFIKTGRPAHPKLPTWPTYEPGLRATMWLDETSHVQNDRFASERSLWQEVTY